ncbi:indolepyruvate ferredoxin oxidoreductase family protein [Mycobacterium sp. AZCC_0083]|uniref:indolepyruvate ferredoxin oxidoreductase family protein n=1 Tax=Mycobacterium sp. AZCC_0083 TaxID=2735882 RepID=UPI001622267A|nr:indolepyruvate ferredoxin oxidoreductase family protein [Mycobacterium sp. AZCC_0083]MBB5167847.1 indolepyruvate ferredoxin oxidoreductase [Mycobacterium sp. AZCC_0083]
MPTPKGRQHDPALDELDFTTGQAYLTGSDILLRLPVIQRKLDAAAGHNTAGYVTGYPGSPLSGLDSLLRRERSRLKTLGVEFNPAINEDLAATAIWGTQNLDTGGVGSRLDGVFGMWYGKGPGVERSTDAMRTANYFGTSRLGGALALAGDDHEARSTVTAQQSEPLFMHMGMPILSPSTLQEFLTFGLAGWALSRYSKLWVGMICLNDLVDAAATIDLSQIPGFSVPDGHEPPPIQLRKGLLEIEEDIRLRRIPAVGRFARANGLNQIAVGGTNRRLGIAVAGKAYLDVIDALAHLGIDEDRAARAGVSVYKLGLVWPIEESGALDFMRGLDEVIVVEAKHPIIEDQLNRLANRLSATERPLIVGKTDERGAPLVPELSGLNARIVASALRRRFGRYDIDTAPDKTPAMDLRNLSLTPVGGALVRAAGFCSGCPHSTSMRVPDGHMNLGGTGCHAMATMSEMDGRQTEILHHMGGEGAMWVGMSPFTDRTHMFQNVGDGTFSHSGSMGVRAAVAAGVNITFKVLVNGFIAMTGGQDIPGQLDTPTICRIVMAEGASKVVVVTEDTRRVRKRGNLPRGVRVEHRKKLLNVETELAKVPGVTVLVYDQECAAELRRHRKRGRAVDPDKRAYINPDVCEGCGDCNSTSNCISVEPLDTPLGRKRRIDQSSCNKDFSCVDGYCPSFVTLYGATPRVRRIVGIEALDTVSAIPDPVLAGDDQETYDIVVGGIGGSGVLTIGAILGRAAFVEGRFVSVLNETGMAQKNGSVQSHVRISSQAHALLSPRIAPGSADLIIGGDIVVAAAQATLDLYDTARACAVVNRDVKPTVAFADNPDLNLGDEQMVQTLRAATGGRLDLVDANELAIGALGDEIYSNVLLIGFAAQRGRLPVSVKAIEEAIELNGVSVEKNLQALRLGRLLAVGDGSVGQLLSGPAASGTDDEPSVAQIVDDRAERLATYQSLGYASSYRVFVDEVRTAEQRIGRVDGELGRAVATYLFKLMAYKDEYEVARMYKDPAFKRRLHEEFDGDFRIAVNLAPQLFNARDPLTGRARKFEIPFGLIEPAFTVLSALRRVRGTPLDVFGKTKHRREERRRIGDYQREILGLLEQLSDDNYDAAVRIASMPEAVRGYDSVKDESAQRALQLQQAHLNEFAEASPS